jgi:hypothetical protein
MENLTLKEKIKILELMEFKDKLELMKTLCELAYLYKKGYRISIPLVDSDILPQDVRDFMTSQGFVFYEHYDNENNKVYAFKYVGKVGE